MKQLTIIVGLIIVAGLVFSLGYLSNTSIGEEKSDISFIYQSMDQCVNEYIKLIKPEKVDNNLLGETTTQCYFKIHGQGLINDFQIRRVKYIQQAYDERILLWMVVIITISGIGLAALQILASYHLATDGKSNLDQSGELLIESKRISLKSSIAGLFILMLSFAFFSVFVFEIYKMETCKDDKNTDKTQAPQQITSGEIEINKTTK